MLHIVYHFFLKGKRLSTCRHLAFTAYTVPLKLLQLLMMQLPQITLLKLGILAGQQHVVQEPTQSITGPYYGSPRNFTGILRTVKLLQKKCCFTTLIKVLKDGMMWHPLIFQYQTLFAIILYLALFPFLNFTNKLY